MKFPLSLLATLALLTVGAATVQAADDARFSKTLPADELTAAGVTRLSSDQVAVLDALVRRDIERADYVSKEPRPAQFSQRLTADERRNAGLSTLSTAEIEQLNTAVARLMPPPRSSATFVTGSSQAGPYSVPSMKLRRDPEIHGSLTLMVGAGSGGYSEYGGAADFTYYDPANKFAITVGYAEVHSKGGNYLSRGCRDPFGRPGLLW